MLLTMSNGHLGIALVRILKDKHNVVSMVSYPPSFDE